MVLHKGSTPDSEQKTHEKVMGKILVAGKRFQTGKTVNIPEIFQVFTVFRSHYKSRGKGTMREVFRGRDKIEWYRRYAVATLHRSPDKSPRG